MKQGVTWLMTAVLLSMITVMPLIACPFLKLDSEMSCCSRTKCPLSKTVETCPFYVTESKIGIKVGKFEITGLPFAITDCVIESLRGVATADTVRTNPPPAADLYLLHRVLLI
jgi:hypothetical protein